MALSPEIREALHSIINEFVKRSMPVAFLVDARDMAVLCHLITLLEDDEQELTREQAKLISNAIRHVWHSSKSLTEGDMDSMARGLELASAEAEAKEAKNKGKPTN